MSPPIYTPDGSEVSEIVLPDGSTASEVIGPDGNVVFEAGPDIPDSTIAQYDATQDAQSTGAITTIADQINGFDLSGNAELISSGINNKQTYRFDGVDDLMEASGVGLTTEPFAVILVVQQQESVDSNNFFFDFEDSGSTFEFALQDNNNATDTLRAFRGGSSATDNDNTNDLNPNILVLEGHNSNEITLRKNGTQIINESIATSNAQDFVLGSANGTQFALECDIGEVVILEGYDTVSGSDITSEESRLSDKWGITI